MKIIKKTYHVSHNATADIYELDNDIEYVEWSNGLKYAYKGSRLLTEAETHAVDKALCAHLKDRREMASIERDLRLERCD